MNEFDEDVKTVDIRDALKKLSNPTNIELISSLLNNYKEASISICFSKSKPADDEINFIIENTDENFSLTDAARIMTKIQSILEYENVMVHLKKMSKEEDFSRFYEKIIPLSDINFIKLLNENYAAFFNNTPYHIKQVKITDAYSSHGLLGTDNLSSKQDQFLSPRRNFEKTGEDIFSEVFPPEVQTEVNQENVANLVNGIIQSSRKFGCNPDSIIQLVTNYNKTIGQKNF